MGAAFATKALRADDLVPEDEETRLQFLLDAVYRRVLVEVHYLVRDSLPVDPATFRLRDEDTEAILREAATRVVGITETTRRAIADVLAQGQREGWTTQEIADGIAHLFDVTWKSRPFTVASTEIAEAQRLAAINRYTASGLVDRVKISDATRGKDHTDTCLARAGTTVPLDEAPPLDHPNCLIGGQIVWAAQVETAFTRWFEGEVIVIRTAANDDLTVTPNHPVLCGRGWVAAGELTERDHIFRCGDGEGITRLLDPDNHHRPAMIEEIAGALRESSGSATLCMPGSPIDFHGDGAYGNVHVIRPHRFPWDSIDRQHVQEEFFRLRLMCECALAAKRDATTMLKRLSSTAHRVMGGDSESLPVFGAGVGVAKRGGFLPIPNGPAATMPSGVQIGEVYPRFTREGYPALSRDVSLVERLELGIVPTLLAYPLLHNRPTPVVELLAECLGIDPHTRRDLAQGLASLVTPTRITQVLRRPFRGHVYNLQTKAGWYVAENIVTHNCSLVLIPVLREGAI